jgi:hypothetical protein
MLVDIPNCCDKKTGKGVKNMLGPMKIEFAKANARSYLFEGSHGF